MSDDSSKPHKPVDPKHELADEDPTDQSPIPDFAKYKQAARQQDQQTDNSITGTSPTQSKVAKLTAIPGGIDNDSSRTREALRESNEMLSRQKEEILELRDAIASMHHEIARLQGALSNHPAGKRESHRDETFSPEAEPAPSAVNRLLVVISGGQRLKYPLFKESMTIGRSPENDIQIATEFVSRVHARVISNHRAATIEDLNSRNGVVVNSRKVSKQPLKNGDLVALGKVQFKFIDLMEDDSGEGRA